MVSNCTRAMLSAFGFLVGGTTLIVSATDAPAADAVADFYRGKQISFAIGYPPGGVFDLGGRLVARHIGKHIPGQPTIVPHNMPGGGSLIAANHLYNVAPKDGTVMGLIGHSLAFSPLWDREGVNYDAAKFTWLGALQKWAGLAQVWHTAPVKTHEQSLQQEVVAGATGAGDSTVIFPRILNALLGTKYRIIPGYQGSQDLNVAIEKGEVQARLGSCWECVIAEKPDWIAEKKINIILQLGLTKHAALSAPVAIELAKTAEDRQIMQLVFASQEMSMPILLPPGIPEDRASALRRAFAEMVKDPEFRADAERARYVLNPADWQTMEKSIREAYGAPAAVRDRAIRIIRGN